ncbi:MAG TPA: hypothetical protein P5050_10535 [Bacteroidia bacterium]|nr:hypothetical protein [Sphingobacteriales bacterium]HPD66058.1 hypothetical protein [Bacteroidia bacterium]HRS59642.1 hypothetical protein [Bacteroidia bacterium]
MRMFFIWLIAIIITLGAAYYQRTTGPTYPKRTELVQNGKTIKMSFPRSEGQKDCAVTIPSEIEGKAVLYFKRYKVDEPFQAIEFTVVDKYQKALLPKQPPAGKLEYFVELDNNGAKEKLTGEDNIIIRYKGDVPPFILIPHIFLMFFAMLLSNMTGLLVIARKQVFYKYLWVTVVFIFLGGMIMGPIVQKYAFGEFWTGIPFGWDLTDNKTLIAFVFWLIALLGNLKKRRPYLALVASIVTIIIFSIPHSMFGSELNYETGVISQG